MTNFKNQIQTIVKTEEGCCQNHITELVSPNAAELTVSSRSRSLQCWCSWPQPCTHSLSPLASSPLWKANSVIPLSAATRINSHLAQLLCLTASLLNIQSGSGPTCPCPNCWKSRRAMSCPVGSKSRSSQDRLTGEFFELQGGRLEIPSIQKSMTSVFQIILDDI